MPLEDPTGNRFTTSPIPSSSSSKDVAHAIRKNTTLAGTKLRNTNPIEQLQRLFKANAGSQRDREFIDPAMTELAQNYFFTLVEMVNQYGLYLTQKERGNIDLEDKIAQAQFNIELAADLYYADHSDPTTTNNAGLFVDIFNELAILDKGFGVSAQSTLNGARAQAGLIEFFKNEKGFRVFYPNPKDYDEVKLWDVMLGIDMIAMSRDGTQCVIIDCKSSIYNTPGDSTSGSLEEPKVVSQRSFAGNNWDRIYGGQTEVVRKLCTTMSIPVTKDIRIFSLTIYLPPTIKHMMKLGRLKETIKSQLTVKLRNLGLIIQ